MSDDLLDEAARLGAGGGRAALATVVRTAGSTPRHAGAHMLIGEAGVLGGTIGGGRIELAVVETGAAVAQGGQPARLVRHLGRDLGMCCGGSMDLWIEPLGAVWPALAEATARRGRREACGLVTDLVGGGKEVVGGDVAGRAARLDGDRFVQPILPAPRLVLFGAGHVAHAVAPLAGQVGFEVVVCDEDERFASEQRFPGARRVQSFEVDEVAAAVGGLGAGDRVLVLTRDHPIDQAIVEALARREGDGRVAWIGMIGSRAKAERFRRRLEAKGLGDPGLHTPVGLDIGAETPAEIAVAVVAELIATRRGGR
jgi:xanthine dehydrogenase accessory factor